MSARTRSATGLPRAVVVVCPTEYGGHIEHAAEFAAAAVRSGVCESSYILSRPCAARSVTGWDGRFEVREILHPRRIGFKLVRVLLQLLDVRFEQRAIRRCVVEIAQTHRVTVLYETSKYGIVRTPVRVDNVLFVHNAVSHSIQHMAARDRLFRTLDRRAAREADRVIVHGDTQRQVVQAWAKTEVISVELPGDTRPVRPSASTVADRFALCLGEVRPNKGIEDAIEAAATSKVKLVIAGQPEPVSYGSEIREVALGQDIDVRLGFLQPEGFTDLLFSAAVVVLPYRSFAAQSGVLARAIQCGKRIIASNLPALREQAQDYPRIDFFPVGDVEALADRLVAALNEPDYDPKCHDRDEAIRKWDLLANRALT